MKHLFLYAVIIVSVSGISSCKEVGPNINLHGAGSVSDTTYIESPVATPAAKNVLIEEFTGVNCPNCPQGRAQVASIEAQYPGKITAIAFHPTNTLGRAFSFSLQDLEDANSTSLLTYLGNPGFEPCAAIDRTLFSGQNTILTDKSYWSGFATQELLLTPQVNIVLSDQYNTSTNSVTVIAEIHYTQAVSAANNITVALTEDSITTAQLDGANIDTNYVHQGVLRTILTAATGDNIAYNANVTLVPGRVVRLVYQNTLNALWKPQNMHVVAFVHEHSGAQVVYQAAEIKLTP